LILVLINVDNSINGQEVESEGRTSYIVNTQVM
jgi:hypothetical protein